MRYRGRESSVGWLQTLLQCTEWRHCSCSCRRTWVECIENKSIVALPAGESAQCSRTKLSKFKHSPLHVHYWWSRFDGPAKVPYWNKKISRPPFIPPLSACALCRALICWNPAWPTIRIQWELHTFIWELMQFCEQKTETLAILKLYL